MSFPEHYLPIAPESFQVATKDNKNFETRKRIEELAISSSKSDKAKKKPKSKFDKLRSKFSPELLMKILEYNLNPEDFNPRTAMKKLLTLGMPIEHIIIDLKEEGKDIHGVQNLLAQHGLSQHLNTAIAKGLENRSSASAIAFAEGLIDKIQTENSLEIAA